MNIIVSGGSGLIGLSFTRNLVENGHKVWVLTRRPLEVKLPAGVIAAGWDAKTPRGWQHLVEQADAVIHLAGENIGDLPWTAARKESIRSSRINAGLAITQAIMESSHKPRVLLQASAIGFYGTHTDQSFTEESQPGSDYLAKVVLDWEASTQGVEALGVRRVITRTGIYLTPEGGALGRFLYPWRLGVGGPLGSGKQWVSWIHRLDELNAMRFLLEEENASGPFNLTAPEPVTNAEFGKTLAEVLQRPFWAPIPAFALKLLLGEMSMIVLDGQLVIPEQLSRMGFKFKFNRLKPALEDLLKKA